MINAECYPQYRYKTVRDPYRYNENSLDVKIFRSFNDINSRFVNSLVSISNNSIAPVSVAAPLGLYIIAQTEDNYYDQSSAVLLALSEITNGIATYGIKLAVKRNRPFRTLNNVKLTDTSDVAGSYSFPSGHTSSSFAIATSLTLRYPDNAWLIAGSYTYAAIVSLGRMYWGVHYPSDVLGGMLIGAGSAALIYSLRVPIINAKNKLFNQDERQDNLNSGNINTGAFLITLAATDFINYYFTKSKNKILKKSKIEISSKADSQYLNYSINF